MTLHTKYRPQTFEEVVGHGPILSSLRQAVAEGTSQAFLFVGPAGTGKTTLARIVAKACGVEEEGLTEIDGATHNGVDHMRDINDLATSYSLTGTGKRAFIIDECHQLSKQAWQAILKILEEPPKHVFWMLCTTEGHKVPKSVQTRCLSYELRPLPEAQIRTILTRAIEGENISLASGILDVIVEEASGSPRQALTLLGKVKGASDVREARELMVREAPSVEAIDLARLLFSQQFNLTSVQRMLNGMKEQSPEGIRIAVFAYAQSVFLGARDDQSAKWALRVMGALEEPIYEPNRIGGLALRLGRLLYLKG